MWNNMDKSQKHYAKGKKSNTKDYILYDAIKKNNIELYWQKASNLMKWVVPVTWTYCYFLNITTTTNIYWVCYMPGIG